jgi:hypothetical protein
MTPIEMNIAMLTFGCAALTFVKHYRIKIEWYWNLAPFGLGFTACLWIARRFG